MDFIQDVCNNESYAISLLNAIHDVLEDLKTRERFRIVDHDISALVGETVYKVRIGKYRLVYRIKRKQSVALVFLFMHDSQELNDKVIASFQEED